MMLVLSIPMPQANISRPHDLPPATDMASPLAMAPAPFPQQLSTQCCKPQRPRLTINTQQNRTFGKGSSLSLDTLSAISPTVRNTFSNAYETPRVKPNSTLSEEAQPETPTTPEPPGLRTPSSGSVSSASTIVDPHVIPYKQHHALRSALANSPIPRSDFRRMSISQTRPLFPPEKRVSFKTPLVEEIKTTKYTWAHSDITSPAPPTDRQPLEVGQSAIASSESTCSDFSDISSLSDSSTSSLSRSSSSSPPPPPTSRRMSYRIGRSRPKPRSPRAGDKRDSSSESDSDSCPETPVAGRRKRRKEIEWTWTLGPIDRPAVQAESHADPEALRSITPLLDGRGARRPGLRLQPLNQLSDVSSAEISTSSDAASSDGDGLAFSCSSSERSTASSTTTDTSF